MERSIRHKLHPEDQDHIGEPLTYRTQADETPFAIFKKKYTVHF